MCNSEIEIILRTNIDDQANGTIQTNQCSSVNPESQI